MKNNFQKEKGIGLIEIIVCLTIIVITFWGFLELISYSLKIQEGSKAKIEAANLAVETIEAIRTIRNENWANLASLSLNTKYYPVILENKWVLTLTDPGPVNGIYNRWLVLEKVYRDTNDDINSLGTEDPETKRVIAFVEWNDRGQVKQTSLTTYLTNWVD